MSWLNKLVGSPPEHELPADWPRCACSCGKPIPRKTIEHGKRVGVPAKYASKTCRKRAERERYSVRVAERVESRDRGAQK